MRRSLKIPLFLCLVSTSLFTGLSAPAQTPQQDRQTIATTALGEVCNSLMSADKKSLAVLSNTISQSYENSSKNASADFSYDTLIRSIDSDTRYFEGKTALNTLSESKYIKERTEVYPEEGRKLVLECAKLLASIALDNNTAPGQQANDLTVYYEPGKDGSGKLVYSFNQAQDDTTPRQLHLKLIGATFDNKRLHDKEVDLRATNREEVAVFLTQKCTPARAIIYSTSGKQKRESRRRFLDLPAIWGKKYNIKPYSASDDFNADENKDGNYRIYDSNAFRPESGFQFMLRSVDFIHSSCDISDQNVQPESIRFRAEVKKGKLKCTSLVHAKQYRVEDLLPECTTGH